MIENFDKFRENTENADILARKGYLVTFGIPPQYPETGYGYLERGGKEAPGYKVVSFREKLIMIQLSNFLTKELLLEFRYVCIFCRSIS